LSNAPLPKPTTITVLVIDDNTLVEKVKAEIHRCQTVWPGHHAEIRVIDVGRGDDAFVKIWIRLTQPSSIESIKQDYTYPPTVPPSVVILDGFQLTWARTIRAATPCPPPILQWMMGFAGGYTRMVAPAYMGGRGDWLRSLTPEALAQIRIQDLPFTGAVVQVPGMPATRDWDQYPQAMDQEQFTKIMAAQCRLAAFIDEADGLVTTCVDSYDGQESLDAMTAWIGEDRDRPTFHLGPMLPPTGSVDISSSSTGSHMKIMSLLDSVLVSHGPQSLLYISFGTQHFPSDPTPLTTLLQTLSDRHLPFVFAHPTHGSLPPQFIDSLPPPPTPSAPYLLTRWAPQQAILAHPACGCFLTHGGYNGTTEALMNGVPMIGWPFAVDQPMNVAHLARNMGVAWELPAAKTGYWAEREQEAASSSSSAEPALPCWEDVVDQVLDEMVGEKGRERRRSAEAVRDKLRLAWEDGGRAKAEFDRFVRMFLD